MLQFRLYSKDRFTREVNYQLVDLHGVAREQETIVVETNVSGSIVSD